MSRLFFVSAAIERRTKVSLLETLNIGPTLLIATRESSQSKLIPESEFAEVCHPSLWRASRLCYHLVTHEDNTSFVGKILPSPGKQATNYSNISVIIKGGKTAYGT